MSILFYEDGDLGDYLSEHRKNVMERVDEISSENFCRCDTKAFLKRKVCISKKEKIEGEIYKINVPDGFGGLVGKDYVNLYLEYYGNKDLLSYRPGFDIHYPSGEVVENKIIFCVPANCDRSEIDNRKREIQYFAEKANNEIEKFDISLAEEIKEKIKQKLEAAEEYGVIYKIEKGKEIVDKDIAVHEEKERVGRVSIVVINNQINYNVRSVINEFSPEK
jgi:hypothetical protein